MSALIENCQLKIVNRKLGYEKGSKGNTTGCCRKKYNICVFPVKNRHMKIRCKDRDSLKKSEGILDPKLIYILGTVLSLKASGYSLNQHLLLIAIVSQL